MLAIRTHISETHADFRRLLSNRKLRGLMGELRGDTLSRVPKGFDAGHPAAELIKHKDWILYVTLDASLATTRQLFTELLARFRAIAPVLEYLNTPLRARKTPPERPEFRF